ncbi:cupin 2 domain-containing protein [Diplogelasinospora grovesii]|uniref:Cupin 2 domain-containing protein n=1 Tax=Diplogelasinospora grovesii TaxID=303347 RepID=A0AAN6N7K7_9PEZI|nr:cupin 2 domain-containing protein [Diplogelasinospora grovesii]
MSGPLGHGLSSSSSRLVRTGHKSDGTSSFISDEVVNPVYPFGPKASAFTIFDVRSAVPVTNTDPPVTPAGGVPRCPPNGATFVITEIPGGGFSSPMHRTLSIDYAVVLWGEIQVELDGGETKVLKKGDCLVQQGVNHKWVNNGTGKCKLLCVMLGANPVALPDGTVLGV